MSWRDSASGSSTFHGGGGMAGNNGNVGAGTGGSGSNNSGSRTGGLGGGLSTGNTWHGNTAFGPSGGRVTGYANVRGGGMFGMMPTVETFSNFKTPSGQDMVGGGNKNKGVNARNAQQALGMLQALAEANRPNVVPTGRPAGILDDEAPPFTGVQGGYGGLAVNADIDPAWGAALGLRNPLGTQFGVRGGYGIPGYGLAAGMRNPMGTQNAVVGGYGTPGYGLSSGGGWR